MEKWQSQFQIPNRSPECMTTVLTGTETRLKGKTKVVQNSLPDVEQQIQIPLRIIGQGLQRNNVKGREVGERSPVLVQNSAFIHIDLAEVFGIHNVFLENTHKTYDYIYY